MSLPGVAQILVFCALLIAITPLLGGYMAKVFTGQRTFASPLLEPVEVTILRIIGVARDTDQDWKRYARSLLLFSALFWLGLYLILRLQTPMGGAPTPDLTFNTVSSFVTNTNWQYYAGETTMSTVSQMVGLAVQNFVSAAVGIAVAVALIRGISARSARGVGSFYVDTVRALVHVLLPLSFVFAIVLVSQGVPETLHALHDGAAVGPVASQEAIKMLGTNGGGFFNVNSAHPFENPNGFTDFLELLSILAIPAALTATFGRMVGSRRQGWAIFAAMFVLFLAGVAAVYGSEAHGSVAQHAAHLAGPNMEGKETRFGPSATSLWAVATSDASNGSVNGAMESLTGFGQAVPMANIMTGEVIFGGVGSGLYGMLLFVLLAVFLAGLMVGRTPEYLGKKIDARDVKLVVLGTLATPLFAIGGAGLATVLKWGGPSIDQSGPQGFSETLYAYVSQAGNNGSALAGYTGYVQPNGDNHGAFGITFADLLGGLVMIGARMLPILASLAVAGSLAAKRTAPIGPGTFRTDNGTFVALLIGVILLVALLVFVPALLLGPVLDGLTDQLF